MDWLEACRAGIYEDGVGPGQVRTHEEHREIVSTQGTWGSFLGNIHKSQFAEYARRLQYRSLRDANLLREVKKGDLVWGLYGGACEWLPASVEAVNDDGTFDLKYLLTEEEVHLAKTATTSRRLLGHIAKEERDLTLEPLSVRDEGQLAERIFEMIDTGKSGELALS